MCKTTCSYSSPTPMNKISLISKTPLFTSEITSQVKSGAIGVFRMHKDSNFNEILAASPLFCNILCCCAMAKIRFRHTLVVAKVYRTGRGSWVEDTWGGQSPSKGVFFFCAYHGTYSGISSCKNRPQNTFKCMSYGLVFAPVTRSHLKLLPDINKGRTHVLLQHSLVWR